MKSGYSINALLVIISLFLSIFLADMIASNLPRKSFPEIYSKRCPQYAPDVGMVLNKPHSCQTISTPYVYNKICYNKYGFRGPDWPLEKSTREYRIAVMGDSFIEGRAVNYDQLMSTRLQKLLDSNVTVMNFGISGSSQAEQLRLYRNVVSKFKPDLTLSFITPSNDFEDNVKELSRKAAGVHLKIDSGCLVETGPPYPTTVLLAPPVSGITAWFGNLAIFKLARNLFAQGAQFPSVISPSIAWASRKDAIVTHLEKFSTAEYANAKKVMKKALLSLKDLCGEHDSSIIFAGVSACWTFLVQDNEGFRSKYELLGLRYKWIRRFCRDNGLEYIDLNKTMLDYCRTHSTPYDQIHIPWDAHWTKTGHRVAALIIADKLSTLRPRTEALQFP